MRLSLGLLILLLTGCNVFNSVTYQEKAVNIPSLEFKGEYSSNGVWVKFDGITYAAVPSHVALEGFVPEAIIEYQNQKYPIIGIRVSSHRDLALLQVNNPPDSQVLAVSQAQDIPSAITKNWEEIDYNTKKSGRLHQIDHRMAFFVGMTFDKADGGLNYYVILDQINPSELEEVNLELLAVESKILRSWRHRNVLVGATTDKNKQRELFLRTLVGDAVELYSCFYMTRRFAEEQYENAENARNFLPID